MNCMLSAVTSSEEGRPLDGSIFNERADGTKSCVRLWMGYFS